MLASLIIMLREGIEAALIVGLTLSYLERTGRQSLRRGVWAGLGLAVLGSVLGAMALQLLPLSEEAVEGTVMLVAAVFVGAMMIWMHRASRHMSADIRGKVDAAAAGTGGAFAIGLFIFFMVMREGAEAVLFLSAVSLTSSGIASLVGALLGIGLAILFAWTLFKGTLQLELSRFFLATSVVLGVMVVELLLHAYHEYSELGWLPATTTSMAIVGPAVKNSVLFVLALLTVPLVLYLVPSKRAQEAEAQEAAAAEAASGPEARKARAARRRRKVFGAAFLSVGALVITLLFFEYVRSHQAVAREPAQPVAATDGVLRIPMEGLASEKLHLFVHEVDGHAVRFFVYLVGRQPKVALDGCEICGPIGYVQRGRQVVCINCGAEIYPPSIGQTGGCNPIPVPFTVENDAIVVREDALAERAAMF